MLTIELFSSEKIGLADLGVTVLGLFYCGEFGPNLLADFHHLESSFTILRFKHAANDEAKVFMIVHELAAMAESSAKCKAETLCLQVMELTIFLEQFPEVMYDVIAKQRS